MELETNQVVEQYKYDTFGQESQRGELSPWGYHSKRIDRETGLIYFGRRYYSPEIGKWISLDPKGIGDSTNLYLFNQNSPLTFFDLYGLESQSYLPSLDKERGFLGNWYYAPVETFALNEDLSF